MGIVTGRRHAKAVVRAKRGLSDALASYRQTLDEENYASAAIWSERIADRYELIAAHLEASWLARRTVKTGVLTNARLSVAWWRGRAEELWKQATAEVRD